MSRDGNQSRDLYAICTKRKAFISLQNHLSRASRSLFPRITLMIFEDNSKLGRDVFSAGSLESRSATTRREAVFSDRIDRRDSREFLKVTRAFHASPETCRSSRSMMRDRKKRTKKTLRSAATKYLTRKRTQDGIRETSNGENFSALPSKLICPKSERSIENEGSHLAKNRIDLAIDEGESREKTAVAYFLAKLSRNAHPC